MEIMERGGGAFRLERGEYQKQAGCARGKPVISFDGPLAALGKMIVQESGG
jgi:hypothetical protein